MCVGQPNLTRPLLVLACLTNHPTFPTLASINVMVEIKWTLTLSSSNWGLTRSPGCCSGISSAAWTKRSLYLHTNRYSTLKIEKKTDTYGFEAHLVEEERAHLVEVERAQNYLVGGQYGYGKETSLLSLQCHHLRCQTYYDRFTY